jgi:predicted metal-dependent HD superfamily phosphohydrolase
MHAARAAGLGDGHALRDQQLARHAEPQRKYHTQQYLLECLRLFDEVWHLAERPHEVEMALWFHDAIYELKSSQNEQRSAAPIGHNRR